LQREEWFFRMKKELGNGRHFIRAACSKPRRKPAKFNVNDVMTKMYKIGSH